MGRWHFRPCFWMTTALKCGASLIEVAIILRWNLAIGIPDKVHLHTRPSLELTEQRLLWGTDNTRCMPVYPPSPPKGNLAIHLLN